MKAIFIQKYGGVEVLKYGEMPEPVPQKGQVLVEVHAASINPRDWLLREGKYVFRYFMPSFPFILGSDISGVVKKVGPGITRFKAGDAVFGMQTPLGGMGGYAEYIRIRESALAHKPPNISHEEAAGVPCAGLTAYAALVNIAQLKVNDQVTILGASGGVGTYAVQIAKAFGANVTATTSASNFPLVESLGADRVIDYKGEDFRSVLRDQDILFDTIGRESLGRCAAVLSRQGRYITTIPNFNNLFEAVRSNFLRFAGLNHGSAHLVLVPSDGLALEKLAALMEKGKIRTVIDSVYSLEEARAAHEKSRTWRTRGKIILRVR